MKVEKKGDVAVMVENLDLQSEKKKGDRYSRAEGGACRYLLSTSLSLSIL
jgi:hypothetical protein